MAPDFNIIGFLHAVCLKKAVSYSVNYLESCDKFYVQIESSAINEGYITKDYDLKTAVKDAVEWVERL